jgi:hypothetical protein
LIDAKLVDPLGGKYELRATPAGGQAWVSSVDDPLRGSDSQPPDYQFPAVRWLHGVEAQAVLQPDSLILHAECELPALAEVSGVEMPALPSLPSLPSLPFSLPSFGKSSKEKASEPSPQQQ